MLHFDGSVDLSLSVRDPSSFQDPPYFRSSWPHPSIGSPDRLGSFPVDSRLTTNRGRFPTFFILSTTGNGSWDSVEPCGYRRPISSKMLVLGSDSIVTGVSFITTLFVWVFAYCWVYSIYKYSENTFQVLRTRVTHPLRESLPLGLKTRRHRHWSGRNLMPKFLTSRRTSSFYVTPKYLVRTVPIC